MRIPRSASIAVRFALFTILVIVNPGCAKPEPVSEGMSGGRLVASFRAEPASFNRFVSPRAAEGMLSLLTNATLVRINRTTGDLEPRLAREWSPSPDRLTWTFKLREGVTFSDGVPFTADDVVFTFQVLYDPVVASQMAGSFIVAGQPLKVSAVDAHTVAVTFPAPYGPGIGILESLPILPKHKLEASLKDGSFRKAWGVTTPPAEVVGLGPFVLQEYVPGQRLRFARNPRFWLRDAKGQTLPYLEGIDVEIIKEENAEVLRLQAGDTDLMNDQVRPDDLPALRKLETEGKIRLVEAGVRLDPSGLWFNLKEGAAAAKTRPWLQREELRRAISYAVDRQAVVNSVFSGEGVAIYGPLTPGHGPWYLPSLPKTEHDVAKAKQLLASIGLTDRNGDGMLEDAKNQPARFAILSQKGNTTRERTVSVLQEQLRQVGLAVDSVLLDFGAVATKIGAGDYDATFFGFQADSADPGRNPDFWLSSGSFHVWNPEQKTPATPWERSIDDRMRTVIEGQNIAERQRVFAEIQTTLAEHLPVIYFAAPKMTIAMSSRLKGATPSVLQPPVLWNAEMLSVGPKGGKQRP